jgi:Major Facilitator Superfamily
MVAVTQNTRFYGWRVVGATFVLAIFGLGMGFHGPAIYLHAVHDATGWPLSLISVAVTVHFLVGAVAVANLPALYRHFGIPAVTKAGALMLAAGILGWSLAAAPWQLFAASVLSGAGWIAMGVAAVNAIVSPWFVRGRPAALAMAYNGGNLGGVVFSPLWAVTIGLFGFPAAAAAIVSVMVLTMWLLSDRIFSRTPEGMGIRPDGDGAAAPHRSVTSPAARPLPGATLWRDRRFLTLATGMALGLFAQIGLIVHLFSLLVPALGESQAGFAMALITAMAIAGRTLIGWALPAGTDWRLVAAVSYAVQIAGSLTLLAAAGTNVPLLYLGIALFGLGFGNGTWLPPLIAQVEFVPEEVARVVALIVAIGQGTYAFAPAVFGLIRDWNALATNSESGAAPVLFGVAALIQGLAVAAFLAGRRRAQGV